jgi:hypothetical protein
MSDHRALLARLNPASTHYDSVGGGLPDMTNEDITGALGLVRQKARFACEVYCALWWPGLSSHTCGEIDTAIRNKQLDEFLRRQRKLITARMAVHVAKEEADGSHGGIPGVRRALQEARGELAEAQARAWPNYSDRYGLIRAAVMNEIRGGRSCKLCAGRGTVRHGDLIVDCQHCKGSRLEPNSERHRAAVIGVQRTAYARWESVYDWTLDLCDRANRSADRAFGLAVGREVAPC